MNRLAPLTAAYKQEMGESPEIHSVIHEIAVDLEALLGNPPYLYEECLCANCDFAESEGNGRVDMTAVCAYCRRDCADNDNNHDPSCPWASLRRKWLGEG